MLVLGIDYAVSLIGWIIAGLIGGWLAGQVSKGSGFGLIGDLVMGVVGALLLGFILNALNLFPDNVGLIGTIIAAFIGALLLTFIVHALTGRRVVP